MTRLTARLSLAGAAASVIAAAISIGAGSGAAWAQNGYSFLDAERSAIDYRLAPAQPVRSCADIERIASAAFAALSVQEVAAADGVPAFCRVLGQIPPEVRFEVALPMAWNRRLYMRGNGGFAGEALDAPPRVAQRNAALRHGFVAVQTNTGHDAAGEPLASFASNPAKKIDYAFRAVHLTAGAARRLAGFFYDRAPAFSYWDGCSTGGRQGLMSMQRYPGDFDGVIVGAPVLNFIDSMVSGVWNAKALERNPIRLEQMPALAAAIYKKCDARDGLDDGVIDDPRQCGFDPDADLPKCNGSEGADCFTPGQIATLKAIYGGVVSGGKPYFPGQPVGAEKIGTPPFGSTTPQSGWAGWLLAAEGANRQITYGESFLRYMAFDKPDPTYDWHRFDIDQDPAKLDEIRELLNATSTDLSAFRNRGGKALMYFGWADTALNPLMGIDYYMRVSERLGPSTRDFFRLFMVPGMFHCRGGVGVDRIDALTPLINWVENGIAPDRIVGSRLEAGKVVRTRPLCPYPQVARHDGSGSVDEAASFTCAAP
ncbi:tannase/feruloyl esterase family alpha/beta hydrolase [Vineibacter terrae]|nr:tannase/feruloyl esterase family alpha/beta hydrolase [Vineibacter terrae]